MKHITTNNQQPFAPRQLQQAGEPCTAVVNGPPLRSWGLPKWSKWRGNPPLAALPHHRTGEPTTNN
ncbi:MAG: hypothetical protein ACHBN1_20635 [Heteroscytonema crispum UTEX LB 1556]